MNNAADPLAACRPILCVANVARSIAYYVESLGFRIGWRWSDTEQRFLEPQEAGESTFALVCRGQVQFMLSQNSQGAAGVWLHLDVLTAEQIDSLHSEWLSGGAVIVEPPALRPWGMYEMRVRDLDGHMLRVSATPRKEGESPSSSRNAP